MDKCPLCGTDMVVKADLGRIYWQCKKCKYEEKYVYPEEEDKDPFHLQ